MEGLVDGLVDLVRGLPSGVAVMALGTVPLTELRAAIPVGMLVFGMPAFEAAAYALIGNTAIVVVLLLALGPASKILGRWSFANGVMERVFASTRARHGPRFERLRDVALVSFVALPLPGTGGWSGALCAFLFGVPFRRAFPLVALGLIISATVVTTLVATGQFVVGVTRP